MDEKHSGKPPSNQNDKGVDSAAQEAPEKTGVRLRIIPGGKTKRAREPDPPEDRFIQTFDLSDTGNAERLAAKFGVRVRYVASWDEHIVYTGTHWRRDTQGVHVGKFAKHTVGAIMDECKYADAGDKKQIDRWKKKSASKGKRQAMVELLKHEDDVALDHADLDRDPWLLNVLNGTLDLRTGALRPHDPKDLITKIIPIAYNPRAKAPRWHKFLREVLPDESTRAFVHRFQGYCLTGDVSERMFVIFLGGGCNGKTAFLNAIESVMGAYAITAAPTLLVAKERESHPTEVADLFGARLAVTSETRKGATFDEERVKKFTGTDRLKARRMREDFWSFEPTHKLLIASNHKPRVKDASDSFWDRVAIVPFDVRIPRSRIDRRLGDKLREEREGILLWLLKGCALWRTQRLVLSSAIQKATQEYRNEEDILGRFLTECCVADETAFTRTSELMAINKAWAESLNLYQASPKELAEKLRAEPFHCEPHKRDGNMGWKGIRTVVQVKLR